MSQRMDMLARKAAVVMFTTLMAILGAMSVPSVVWMFTLGLLPSWVQMALAVPGAGFAGYWAYQHTVYKDWLYPH